MLDETRGVVFVIDGEVGAVAKQRRIVPEHAGAGRVERADPHPFGDRAQQAGNPILHLACGPVGEGYCQRLMRTHLPAFDEIGETIGQHPGLARSRPGEHEERPAAVKDGLTLSLVEVCG